MTTNQSLQTVIDHTISDRLTTQVNYESTIQSLKNEIQRLRKILGEHYTEVSISSDGLAGKYSFSIQINGVNKTIQITNVELDYFLTSSAKNNDPGYVSWAATQMTNEIAEALSEPYTAMIAKKLKSEVESIIRNRITEQQGSKL